MPFETGCMVGSDGNACSGRRPGCICSLAIPAFTASEGCCNSRSLCRRIASSQARYRLNPRCWFRSLLWTLEGSPVAGTVVIMGNGMGRREAMGKAARFLCSVCAGRKTRVGIGPVTASGLASASSRDVSSVDSAPESSGSESEMIITSRKISSSWSRPVSSSPRHLTSVSRHRDSTTFRAFCQVVSLRRSSYLVCSCRICASTAS